MLCMAIERFKHGDSAPILNVSGFSGRMLPELPTTRQSEVQSLRVPAALGHENISGLDVAVDDSFCVRSVPRICDLDGQ